MKRDVKVTSLATQCAPADCISAITTSPPRVVQDQVHHNCKVLLFPATPQHSECFGAEEVRPVDQCKLLSCTPCRHWLASWKGNACLLTKMNFKCYLSTSQVWKDNTKAICPSLLKAEEFGSCWLTFLCAALHTRWCGDRHEGMKSHRYLFKIAKKVISHHMGSVTALRRFSPLAFDCFFPSSVWHCHHPKSTTSAVSQWYSSKRVLSTLTCKLKATLITPHI